MLVITLNLHQVIAWNEGISFTQASLPGPEVWRSDLLFPSLEGGGILVEVHLPSQDHTRSRNCRIHLCSPKREDKEREGRTTFGNWHYSTETVPWRPYGANSGRDTNFHLEKLRPDLWLQTLEGRWELTPIEDLLGTRCWTGYLAWDAVFNSSQLIEGMRLQKVKYLTHSHAAGRWQRWSWIQTLPLIQSQTETLHCRWKPFAFLLSALGVLCTLSFPLSLSLSLSLSNFRLENGVPRSLLRKTRAWG